MLVAAQTSCCTVINTSKTGESSRIPRPGCPIRAHKQKPRDHPQLSPLVFIRDNNPGRSLLRYFENYQRLLLPSSLTASCLLSNGGAACSPCFLLCSRLLKSRRLATKSTADTPQVSHSVPRPSLMGAEEESPKRVASEAKAPQSHRREPFLRNFLGEQKVPRRRQNARRAKKLGPHGP